MRHFINRQKTRPVGYVDLTFVELEDDEPLPAAQFYSTLYKFHKPMLDNTN